MFRFGWSFQSSWTKNEEAVVLERNANVFLAARRNAEHEERQRAAERSRSRSVAGGNRIAVPAGEAEGSVGIAGRKIRSLVSPQVEAGQESVGMVNLGYRSE